MTDTLPLATMLRAMDDDTLTSGLKMRAVAPAGIRDFFDLADALLDSNNIQTCLALLDRPTLRTLWQLAGGNTDRHTVDTVDTAIVETLRSMLFLDAEGAALSVVTEQLNRWPSIGLPEPSTLDTPPPAPDPRNTTNTEPVDHIAAEHAFAATTAIAELLFDLHQRPARLLAKGDLGVPETRRLADAMTVDEAAVPTLVGAAERAGLVIRQTTRLVTTTSHQAWLAGTASERWLSLVTGWTLQLPTVIRDQLASQREVRSVAVLREWLDWLYPGGGAWLRQQLGERLAEAEQLGISANGTLSAAGAAMISGDRESASELLAAQLPSPVRQLYLQHDLTLVAPGPLDATIDTRLRSMADVEGRAVASRFRLSGASIDRAITGGETADTILDFLTEISLTAMPQPVEYLVRESANRHGRLRVGGVSPATVEATSYIRSDDSALLGTLLVDTNLTVLGLSARNMNEIVSRRDLDQLYWTLIEARYPVAAEDATRTVIRLARNETPHTPTPVVDKVAALVQKLRASDDATLDDTGQIWLARQLEAAIRSRSTVTVSVRMPNGTIVEHSLEPASLSGGRLRAKDPLSEIERTLPLSSIAAVSAG